MNKIEQTNNTKNKIIQESDDNISVEEKNKITLANIKQQFDQMNQLMHNIKKSNESMSQINQTNQTNQYEHNTKEFDKQNEQHLIFDIEQQLDEIKKRLDDIDKTQKNIIKIQNNIANTIQNNIAQTSNNVIKLNEKFLKINMNTTINIDSIVKIEKHAGFVKIYTNIKKQTLKNEYETYVLHSSYYQNIMNLFFPVE